MLSEHVFEKNGRLLGKIRIEDGIVWFDFVRTDMDENEFDYFTDQLLGLDEIQDFNDDLAATLA